MSLASFLETRKAGRKNGQYLALPQEEGRANKGAAGQVGNLELMFIDSENRAESAIFNLPIDNSVYIVSLGDVVSTLLNGYYWELRDIENQVSVARDNKNWAEATAFLLTEARCIEAARWKYNSVIFRMGRLLPAGMEERDMLPVMRSTEKYKEVLEQETKVFRLIKGGYEHFAKAQQAELMQLLEGARLDQSIPWEL